MGGNWSMPTEVWFDVSGAETDIQGLDRLFDGVATTLDVIVDKMEELVTLMVPQEKSFFEGLVGGVDVFNTLADGRTNIEEIFESINKGFEKSEGGAFNVLKALVP